MNDGKGMSIAALVLGILSAIFAWWGLYIGIVSLVCGIVGIVLAVKGKKAAAAALAIIGTSLSVIGVIACGICVICSASATKGIEDALGSGALDDLQSALDQIS